MKQERIEFQSYDGLRLVGDYVEPEKMRGAALLVHGIQSYRDEYGFYSDMAMYFCDKSIASFRFDYRCHGESTPLLNMHEITLSGVLNDIDAAFRVLCSKVISQTQQLSLVGTSFGGGVSLYYANKMTSKVSRVVLAAPVIDYQRDYLIDQGLWSNNQVNALGSEQLNTTGKLNTSGRPFGRAMVNELRFFGAPLDNKIPTIIFHGDRDTAEPVEYSKQYIHMARNVTLTTVPGAEHGFAKPGDDELTDPVTKRNHVEVYGMMVDFLSK